jgi:type III restriction enzyme
MKDKEKLLTFETKLKFIFSHSALKEGWDNPNVFQICALREMGTERERRQTLGRGLRLSVNQKGERLRGFEINTLTVIATESYEAFVENLQKEIEKDTGIKFGIVERHQFAAIPVVKTDGSTGMLGFEESAAIFDHLKMQGLVDAKGKVQDTLRAPLKDGTFALPKSLEAHLASVRDVLKKVAGKLDIKNADERVVVKTRQAVLAHMAHMAIGQSCHVWASNPRRNNLENLAMVGEPSRTNGKLGGRPRAPCPGRSMTRARRPGRACRSFASAMRRST